MCDAEDELYDLQKKYDDLLKKFGDPDDGSVRGEIQDLLCSGCDRELSLAGGLRWPCLDCKSHYPRVPHARPAAAAT